MKRTHSIKFRLIITFSLLAIISNLSVGLISSRLTASLFMKTAKDQTLTTAKEGARLVESRMRTQMAFLEAIAMQDDIRSMKLDQASSAMTEQNSSMEEIFKSSERLAHLSENLQAVIKRFKL